MGRVDSCLSPINDIFGSTALAGVNIAVYRRDATMTQLVLGIFEHHADASLAIEDLKDSGIKAKNISVVTKQKHDVDLISQNAGIGKVKLGDGNSGLFGTARAVSVGLDMIPDTAVAAGPAASMLGGAELEESHSDVGLARQLMEIGIPKEDAEGYARHAERENIIVIVLMEEENSQQVSTLFNKHHAIPLESL
jgi:hypothetical protein